MKLEEIRQRLIDGTIHVIARDGLDKATTKLIRIETATNEAYIYRCFAGKEDMFAETFAALDQELVTVATQHVQVMYQGKLPYENRCWVFFSSVWKFMLGNRDKCLTYIRYYYSPYFQRYSVESHTGRYKTLVKKFSDAFREEANVWMLLNHILNVMLNFAVKVFDGVVPDNDETAEHVFRLIYGSVRQYFRKKEC